MKNFFETMHTHNSLTIYAEEPNLRLAAGTGRLYLLLESLSNSSLCDGWTTVNMNPREKKESVFASSRQLAGNISRGLTCTLFSSQLVRPVFTITISFQSLKELDH